MSDKSSRRWLQEHFSDSYVKKAKQAGLRSRASFKLQELQEKYHLFKPGMCVIDLGAAPGGWSQLLVKYVGAKGKVIAMDILPMDPIQGVLFLQGDFTEDAVFNELNAHIEDQPVHWVVSDMAPNTSGNETIDVPRSVYLAELALAFALKALRPSGGFLVKIFQGEGFDAYYAEIKKYFKSTTIIKPKASRGRSREIYVLARDFKQS